MKKFSYSYATKISFSAAVSRHAFLLRCVPGSNSFQQAYNGSLTVEPQCLVSEGFDSWGNPIQYGLIGGQHDSFSFVSSGEVAQLPYVIDTEPEGHFYKLPSALTRASDEMADFALGVPTAGGSFETAVRLSELIGVHMSYVPGSTSIETTASDAFGMRKGVCQDYAHILLSLCRHKGISCRYVNGFILGEGETHAWAEVYDGSAWRGIDPTHGRIIEYGYIKLSHGRDALDCQVCRGTFTGCAAQECEVKVMVQEL